MSIAIISSVISSLRRRHLRRQEINALLALDDRLLRDIGIERCDIVRVVDLEMGALHRAETRRHAQAVSRILDSESPVTG